jgi:hypothetical protein
MFAFSSSLIRVYLEESLLWDGNIQISKNHKRQEIFTAEKERAEVLHTLAHLSGFGSQFVKKDQLSGFGSVMYSVSLNQRTQAALESMTKSSKSVQEVPVFCVTVKSGFFFVRRNGKIMITGNSNYGMKKHTMHENIFKKSKGELWVHPDQCDSFQKLYFRRYPGLHKVHAQIVRIMNQQGYLDSFAGTRRMFFGRKDNTTVRDMLAHLPQAHTAFATNTLLERVYFWPVNRRDRNELILEPVNQVHDEADMMFKQADLGRVREMFPSLTELEMEVWGIKFQIPFEANYGLSWGDCETPLSA